MPLPTTEHSHWQALTKMPFWLARPASELDKLRRAAIAYWQKLEQILAWPSKQLDPMTAELELVDLLAWERDISRIPQESEKMYRTRVKYALPFAKGAGSKSGWMEMFHRLGMPHITIDERDTVKDWDVVSLQVLDADLGDRDEIIGAICRHYGRTTRRYQYTTIASMPLVAPPSDFDFDSLTGMAGLTQDAKPVLALAVMDNESVLVIAGTTQH